MKIRNAQSLGQESWRSYKNLDGKGVGKGFLLKIMRVEIKWGGG